ncbi:VQ motif-containing protein [Actinidia chinensis var. chinensis]|uniref:VQ motif-containing protein n=1 Tax=Actinidia chinensis var. chinensis TaxID=1590841 RepID=A0A2R6R5C5_ACTCC|nr:VQ motif-containing protein [Actinidia chinensis var. chinensis]
MESQYDSSSSSTNKPPHFHSMLHSVRKVPVKPLKKPIAPSLPTPPKIYKVAPIDFKYLVQMLTGGPELQSSRLQSVAPPPLSLSTTKTSSDGDEAVATLELLPDTTTTPLSATYRDLMSQTLETKPWKPSNGFGAVGFSLSPSSNAWCSFLLPSPGTLST